MIKQLIDTLLEDMHRNAGAARHLSFEDYIREFRTISLGLPRRSGKTTMCKEHAKNTSSYYFSEQYSSSRFNAATEFPKLYGTKGTGMKLDCIILEEYNKEFPYMFSDFLAELKCRDMLKPEFYVLMIGTPR